MFNKIFKFKKSNTKDDKIDLDFNFSGCDYEYDIDSESIKEPKSIRWTEEELALFDKGLSNIEIMATTGRTMSAVITKRSRLKNK